MALKIRESNAYLRDLKKIIKRGKNLQKLGVIIHKLAHAIPLEHKHRNHSLKGNWQHYSECHIEPDWLLIYRIEGDELKLARTGSHSDLFD